MPEHMHPGLPKPLSDDAHKNGKTASMTLFNGKNGDNNNSSSGPSGDKKLSTTGKH